MLRVRTVFRFRIILKHAISNGVTSRFNFNIFSNVDPVALHCTPKTFRMIFHETVWMKKCWICINLYFPYLLNNHWSMLQIFIRFLKLTNSDRVWSSNLLQHFRLSLLLFEETQKPNQSQGNQKHGSIKRLDQRGYEFMLYMLRTIQTACDIAVLSFLLSDLSCSTRKINVCLYRPTS